MNFPPNTGRFQHARKSKPLLPGTLLRNECPLSTKEIGYIEKNKEDLKCAWKLRQHIEGLWCNKKDKPDHRTRAQGIVTQGNRTNRTNSRRG